MIYITGDTQSSSFPTTAGAFDTSYGGNGDAFVAKFDPTLSGSASLIYSSFLGGGGYDYGYGIAVASDGKAFVTGGTSGSFAITGDAYQSSYGGGSVDSYLSIVSADGSSLVYSTYLGGSGNDFGYGIAVNGQDVYLTGRTASNNFPTTPGAYDTTQNGGDDAFVVKFVPITISGTVFEDVNYGGGAGRSKAASSGVGRSAARLELFDSGGAYVTAATTDGSGNFTFGGLYAGSYIVRVVTSSVTSSRTGYTASCLPVMTYRTNASSGTAVAVTDYVGGHDPATADAGNAASGWVLNSSTGAFSGSGSGKAHAFAPVTISSAHGTGVDFGWNFDTIANTNDTGPGEPAAIHHQCEHSRRGCLAGAVGAGGRQRERRLHDLQRDRRGRAAFGQQLFSSGVATISLTSGAADHFHGDGDRRSEAAGVDQRADRRTERHQRLG